MNDAWRENVSKAVSGAKNGNALDITNEVLETRVSEYIQMLGYQPSYGEYKGFAKENGLPQSLSAYRQAYFGRRCDAYAARVCCATWIRPT